uniref:Vesicle-fusing ATPase n=1 Tax=Spironucleus salmonicida TaxID=348837 RepID=V6LT00_9EUKA|eukprot:EST47700.1 ATPase associated with various cellular activities family protein [Spironucleus salmonicida]
MEFTFEPCKATQTDQALQNCAFLNTSDYKICCDKVQTVPLYLQANGIVMLCQPLPEVKAGYIMLNAQLRTHARISLISKAAFMAFISSQQNYLESVQFTVAPKKTLTNIDSDELFNIVKQSFNNRYFYPGAIYYTDYQGTTLEMSPKQEGILNSFTQISFSPAPAAKKLILSGSHVDGTTVGQSALSDAFKKMAKSEIEGGDQSENEIDIQSIGIGGLNAQFTQIFRRAFVSRMFPPHLVRKYDLQHVRGILLFGPPGTGKTLIARKIGQLLNTKEPKIVSGPEILDMYVGNSEANIRKLFADAEKDWKELGDESELHLIVMDELDAICKQRGSRGDSTGTYDSIVNQLLAKMDGVDSLGNILVVGMTNRKDLIDSALLRPGRFEVHVEIHLPDLQGRHQILLSILRL